MALPEADLGLLVALPDPFHCAIDLAAMLTVPVESILALAILIELLHLELGIATTNAFLVLPHFLVGCLVIGVPGGSSMKLAPWNIMALAHHQRHLPTS